ncbi:MAG: SMI1/KNR4 family protein [Lachnospiraceae bacterium]|nr:SMI1/KNR4 family protein [Lachnospiraceae bacterium]
MYNTEGIKDLFDDTYVTGALIIKPATDEEIARCNEDMGIVLGSRSSGDRLDTIRQGNRSASSSSAPKLSLPEGYVRFLKIANGYAWNGFEFFGTYRVTEKKSGYTIPDIVTMNQDMHERKLGLTNMIVLGRFDDDLYVYNYAESKYQALDNLTLFLIDSFKEFDDLFICYVSMYTDEEKISYDDESDDDEFDDEDIIEDDGNADQ